ncbi:MAG: dihydroorotate dehydrogenase (quinone), partial [Hyphomicrobiales bacterium]|nr:dihydroorotate dehydrogenase (quinone) [Hyphomicrobiales bacterium]
GHAAALARLKAHRGGGPLGVNVGANKDAPDRAADYVAGVRAFAEVADWLTINVSSPNTPGLRDLQSRAALDDLLARAIDARAAAPKSPPLLLKIAPDVGPAELDDIVEVARARRIDGLIVSNTTVSRPPGLSGAAAFESGGLSGAPLFDLSTRVLREAHRRVGGQFPLIGCGGIGDADALVAKLEAGAALVQVYTAFAYGGPGFITRLRRDLPGALARRGHASVAAATASAA